MITNWFKSIGIWIHGHLNVLIGIHQSRSSCLIYVTKFVQVISCNLPSTENFPGKHQVLGIVSGTAKVMLPSDSIDQFEAFDQLFADVQEILKQRAAGHGADGVVGIRFEQTVANVQVAPKFLVLTGYGTMIKLVK